MTAPIYVPWVRSGFVRSIQEVDALNALLPARASFQVTAEVAAGQSATVDLRLLGPGDVIGFDASAVLRTQPQDRGIEVEPNYFCCVELTPSDLPWMFTPASHNQNRLRPFIVLVVVPADTCSLEQGNGNRLPVLHIDSVTAQLPDLRQSHAWAHAEVKDAEKELTGEPGSPRTRPAGIARLVCPRHLTENKSYIAAIVPAFEHGRLAGLGLPVPETETMTGPAWTVKSPAPSSPDPIDLPVYYSWTFTSGADGDFESLVGRLKRFHLEGDAAKGIPAAVEGQANVLPALPGWTFPGALGRCPVDAPGANFVDPLIDLIDGKSVATGLPLAPPFYGGRHAAEPLLARSTRNWLRQLNTDPRNRSAAAIGTRIVQEHQEDLMAAAWRQIGAVETANQLLRQAQMARAAATVLHERMKDLQAADLLQLVGPMQTRLRAAGTVGTIAAEVGASRVPGSMVSGAFRRAMRPRGALGRRSGGSAARLLVAVNDGIPVVAPRPRPPKLVTIDQGRSGKRWCTITAELVTSEGTRDADDDGVADAQPPGITTSWKALVDCLAALHRDKPPCDESNLLRPRLELESTRTAILAGTTPATTIAQRIASRIQRKPGVPMSGDPLAPIMATPRLDTPLSRDLIALAPNFLLPGISGLPVEAVSAVEQNTRFVEALMIGANHEMMRELVWRGYPTDQRGTCLHRFWDRAGAPGGATDDIPAIDGNWQGELGTHLLGDSNLVVLVVRGEVLRRYPRTVIYANKAEWIGTRRRPVAASGTIGVTQKYPAFTGVIPPDVTYVGFDLPGDARGKPDPNDGEPGWFFVFEQPASETRFGLDEEAPKIPVGGSADLSWEAVTKRSGYVDLSVAPTGVSVQGWGLEATSADLAVWCEQKPFRVMIHASDLLSELAS